MPTTRAADADPISHSAIALDAAEAADAADTRTAETAPALLRIQEVAAETGATARAVRYYEEIGLLQPAARSDGDYRLYDASDVERIRHIRELRDVAGFSLAEIGQLLEDEAARATNREVYRATDDPAVRRGILVDSLSRVDRQLGVLQGKIDRLETMIREAEERRVRLQAKLGALSPGPETVPPKTRARTGR